MKMSDTKTGQASAAFAPVRQARIHERPESRPVIVRLQMRELVHTHP